ncbi:hypothetical protein AURDEDRAFT_178100 [Auricularia subglabra TFB-10046 SS5]|uniref:Uncharacterized protein n=1 Tax=Auricularia subglabra (strain TFB-10046 / SS5) TaxID=717982 RepID=J0D2F2_AURST|nr:hypothetical protein AURDEDRAFT_178100 [Auricularia subglabra TFB-10046 SS5]
MVDAFDVAPLQETSDILAGIFNTMDPFASMCRIVDNASVGPGPALVPIAVGKEMQSPASPHSNQSLLWSPHALRTASSASSVLCEQLDESAVETKHSIAQGDECGAMKASQTVSGEWPADDGS